MSTEVDSHYRPNQHGNDFKAFAMPFSYKETYKGTNKKTKEEIIEKTTNSAFIGTKLEEKLRARHINQIIIIGVIINNSVEATARMQSANHSRYCFG